MAIDPNAKADAEPTTAAAIDNEFPEYRAVSSLAVTSLLFGILSLASFLNPWFLLAGAGAFVTGVLASRKIRKLHDVLTGLPLAQAGIALALVTSLSSVTINVVQTALIRREGERFARSYIKVLQAQDLATAVWFKLPPVERAKMRPKQALDAVLAYKSTDPNTYMTQAGKLEEFEAHVKGLPPDAVHLDEMEIMAYDRMRRPYLQFRMRLDLPDSADLEDLKYALVEVMRDDTTAVKGHTPWFVSRFMYPYHRESLGLLVEPVDDGHGHSH